MDKNSKIYIAGHKGLVGSAIIRELEKRNFNCLITRTHTELDLTNQMAVQSFFEQEKPDYVILAAAKVGGIYANNIYPADFIYQNIMIEANCLVPQSYGVSLPQLQETNLWEVYYTLMPRLRH